MTSHTRPTPAYQRFTPHAGSGAFAVVDTTAIDVAGRRLRLVALLVAGACIAGIFACDFLLAAEMPRGHAQNGFMRPYALHEPPFLWLLSAFAAVVLVLARRRNPEPTPRARPSAASPVLPAVLVAFAVALTAVAGAIAVMDAARRPSLLINPLLAAISVMCLTGASARLWRGDARRERLAILYLATSAQFLFVSMTERIWAAHLCFNLLWLYLVLREDRFGLGAAPWVGIAALSLQNPLAHVLFAAPFLLRVVRSRRLGWIGYYAVMYGGAAAGLYVWGSTPGMHADSASAFDLLARSSPDGLVTLGMNLTASLTWQPPAMALFLTVGAFLVRSLKPPERDLLAGIVLTFAFYSFFGVNADHALGYAHLYPMLGSAALIAASATVSIAGQRGGTLVPRVVAASTAAALLVQLPLRAIQTERAMRPADTTTRAAREAPAASTDRSRTRSPLRP